MRSKPARCSQRSSNSSPCPHCSGGSYTAELPLQEHLGWPLVVPSSKDLSPHRQCTAGEIFCAFGGEVPFSCWVGSGPRATPGARPLQPSPERHHLLLQSPAQCGEVVPSSRQFGKTPGH